MLTFYCSFGNIQARKNYITDNTYAPYQNTSSIYIKNKYFLKFDKQRRKTQTVLKTTPGQHLSLT